MDLDSIMPRCLCRKWILFQRQVNTMSKKMTFKMPDLVYFGVDFQNVWHGFSCKSIGSELQSM